MSFGIVVLSHAHSHLTREQTLITQVAIVERFSIHTTATCTRLQSTLSCHKLHVGMYVAASLCKCSTTTGKVLVKNVERKIMYSFIAENDYKFRNCSFNLIKVHSSSSL